jgi:iron(III) transport system substrate-binding protein
MPRRFPLLAALATLTFVFSACGNASAPNNKLMVLCALQEDSCQAITRAFHEKTNIEISYVRMSSGEIPPRLGARKDNPEFDTAIGGTTDTIVRARNEGLLEPYLSPNAAVIPAQYKDPGSYWSGVYWGVLGFCSNQQILNELGVPVPQSWEDLLDPRLKTQVAMSHPATSGTGYTAIWTLITLNDDVDGDLNENLGESAGISYLRKLNNNILQYPRTGSASGQMVGWGEVAVGIIFAHDCLKLKEAGMKDLVVSFPKEGTGYEIGGVAVVKGARNIEAAKQFVDWMLTVEAQEISVAYGRQYPTNPNVKADLPAWPPPGKPLVDYDFEKAAAYRDAIVKIFLETIEPLPRQ